MRPIVGPHRPGNRLQVPSSWRQRGEAGDASRQKDRFPWQPVLPQGGGQCGVRKLKPAPLPVDEGIIIFYFYDFSRFAKKKELVGNFFFSRLLFLKAVLIELRGLNKQFLVSA